MTVTLSNNFFQKSRGVTFLDGGGTTWSINKNTNSISAVIGGASTWPLASGFGTPTGSVIISNFPGATATLMQCSESVAEILTVLKAAGIIAA